MTVEAETGMGGHQPRKPPGAGDSFMWTSGLQTCARGSISAVRLPAYSSLLEQPQEMNTGAVEHGALGPGNQTTGHIPERMGAWTKSQAGWRWAGCQVPSLRHLSAVTTMPTARAF